MVAFKTAGVGATIGVLSLVPHVDAFWRMPCRSRTGLARLDPIMAPGQLSDHAHAIHGGGGFSMDVKATELKDSSCTSCEVTQDKSAYWTPSLHFMYPNGTTVIVPQIGGMLAYYLLYANNYDTTKGKITAFPDGFQMIAGDKNLRNFTLPVPDPPTSEWTPEESTQAALRQKALGFNCLNYNKAGEPTLYRHSMPDKTFLDQNCSNGLRLEIMFPSCWNGKDLDSSDHKSHVAYPSYVMTGMCPEGFDVKLPSLLYETIWDTYSFSGIDGQFVLSHGDPTGNGYHGDFMMGWESTDFLQQAVDTCTNLSGNIQDCPLFNIQSDATAAQCTFDVPEAVANDNVSGPRSGLPVSVPIQSGPAYATSFPVFGQIGVATVTSASIADKRHANSRHRKHHKAKTVTTTTTTTKHNKKKHHHATQTTTATTPTTTTQLAEKKKKHKHRFHTKPAGDYSTVRTEYITRASEIVELIVLATPVTETITVKLAKDCTTTTTTTPAVKEAVVTVQVQQTTTLEAQAEQTTAAVQVQQTMTTAVQAQPTTTAANDGPVAVGVEGGDGTGLVVGMQARAAEFVIGWRGAR
ncbi:hypothetical protein K461DRAFT_299390 [Myriangium duriaei CBS 260.36]|uniref:DUF1996 domain-containing protein n=1 Tax=Myriangium duriaei CBS 260.36 TaxID=1168546 RepID=A0A9P4J9P5_9PEZI|nr:hypothetical protein K461DRAFT_299390 [Myriangium duriaei CBS 260.36]